MMRYRHLPARAGAAWLSDAFGLVRRHPFIWIAMSLCYGAAALLVTVLPFVGMLAVPFLSPFATAAFLYVARQQDRGEPLRLSQLKSLLRDRALRLVALGALYFVVLVAIALVMQLAGLSVSDSLSLLEDAQNKGDAQGMVDAFRTLAQASVLNLVLFIPLWMADKFSTPLVVLDDEAAWRAVRLSFGACFYNSLPLVAYSALWTLCFVLSLIPLGLGVFVLGPLTIIANYTSYRGTFTKD